MNPVLPGEDVQHGVRQFVADLWCELLSVTDVGDSDNFFGLGGHSLTAMQLIATVEQNFGIEIGSMRDLCQHPTLAAFVALVSGKQAPASPLLP
jgi:aryl carrier-like protein